MLSLISSKHLRISQNLKWLFKRQKEKYATKNDEKLLKGVKLPGLIYL